MMRYLSLDQQRILFVLALFLFGILTYKFYDHSPLPPEETIKEIVIEVSGEIQKPGIYIFNSPPTLKEAIEKAGGLKEIARFDPISSTERLETGTLLTVTKEPSQIPSPTFLGEEGQEEIEGGDFKIKISRMEANKLLVFSIPLDLNRVSHEDLCLIPEIGESLANEMIAYRERRKGFRSVEEIKNIKGIGEKKYQSLKNFFTIRN
ncbi:MAG: helix-hairpin-helix domain-containing protein [Syntrophaceae bacterium]|nr:helix-hairpin-helix domain-containing protein [Syntrophaceae bacterium]